MSKYKWYRKWRGGYWIYEHIVGWYKIPEDRFLRALKDRCGNTEYLENYTNE